jgi:hypothetical protein
MALLVPGETSPLFAMPPSIVNVCENEPAFVNVSFTACPAFAVNLSGVKLYSTALIVLGVEAALEPALDVAAAVGLVAARVGAVVAAAAGGWVAAGLLSLLLLLQPASASAPTERPTKIAVAIRDFIIRKTSLLGLWIFRFRKSTKPVRRGTGDLAHKPMSWSRPTTSSFRDMTARTARSTPGINESRPVESWRILRVWPCPPKTTS